MKVDVFWLFIALLPTFVTGYCVGDSTADRDLERMRDRIIREVQSEGRHQGDMTRDAVRFQSDMVRNEVRWRCP